MLDIFCKKRTFKAYSRRTSSLPPMIIMRTLRRPLLKKIWSTLSVLCSLYPTSCKQTDTEPSNLHKERKQPMKKTFIWKVHVSNALFAFLLFALLRPSCAGSRRFLENQNLPGPEGHATIKVATLVNKALTDIVVR